MKVRVIAMLIAAAGIAACNDKPTEPNPGGGATLLLTAAHIDALNAAGDEIVTANPGNIHLKALVDSTLGVLGAGIEAKRLDLTTNLTTDPLYFVAIHRVVSQNPGAFSTWTLVGFDDPSDLESLIQVSGFAQSSTGTAPTSLTGTVGDGTGVVNALMLQVGNAGAVTEWHANAGTVSFLSGTPGAACPNFVAPNPGLTCALETIRVQFSVTAPASGSAGARNASVSTQLEVPGIRLTYTP